MVARALTRADYSGEDAQRVGRTLRSVKVGRKPCAHRERARPTQRLRQSMLRMSGGERLGQVNSTFGMGLCGLLVQVMVID